MKWLDNVWGTSTERELKQLYVAMMNLKKDNICTSIRLALETKKFWINEKSKLQEMREKRNMTIEELSRLASIPAFQISKYESGLSNINHAKFSTIFSLSVILDCDVWDIVEIKKHEAEERENMRWEAG